MICLFDVSSCIPPTITDISCSLSLSTVTTNNLPFPSWFFPNPSLCSLWEEEFPLLHLFTEIVCLKCFISVKFFLDFTISVTPFWAPTTHDDLSTHTFPWFHSVWLCYFTFAQPTPERTLIISAGSPNPSKVSITQYMLNIVPGT